jgi:putative nucleotidyltransferase with HDIG domain
LEEKYANVLGTGGAPAKGLDTMQSPLKRFGGAIARCLKLLWWRNESVATPSPSRDFSVVVEVRSEERRVEETGRGEKILQDNNVETAELGDLAKLPPFRPIAISLLRLFDRDDVKIDEVSAMVETDPTMASEILAIVNSPLFGVQQTVSQPSHAITLLGVNRTKSLAATLAMRSLMQGAPRTPVVRRFWVHTLATATIARHFAQAFGLEPEISYVAALMHDLGRSGLLAAYQDSYMRLACAAHENTAEILAQEKVDLGMDHCHAGILLAKAWNLPTPFQNVAEHHHDATSNNPLVRLVRLCCRLADDLGYMAIHRSNIRKPEETIAQCAPEHLCSRLRDELQAVSAAVDAEIKALDF